MHWTTELGACPECGVHAGRAHELDCAMRATSDISGFWMGPPSTPDMFPRLLHEGDPVSFALRCQHCNQAPQPGEVVFENRHQAILIHANCVLQMAAMVPRVHASVEEVETEYARRQAEIQSSS